MTTYSDASNPTLAGVESFPMNLAIPLRYATTGHPPIAPSRLSSGGPDPQEYHSGW